MTSADTALARPEAPAAAPGWRLFRAAEAAGHVAGGLHRLCRSGAGAGQRCTRYWPSRIALHRGWRRRAGAINMWYDAISTRSCNAPGAADSGRPHRPGEALASAVTCGRIGGAHGLAVNWAAGALLALAIAFYVFVYTMWLKRRTPQNIVIGGAAGAFPPMIGWAAVTGRCRAWRPSCFSLIIFMWTPPHFWALAALPCPRLRAGQCADAARGRRPGRNPPPDLDLLAPAGAGHPAALCRRKSAA